MKYTIQINQAGADAANLRGKLDIIDLAIFDAFKDFANCTKCEKKMSGGRMWFWISYALIINEIPYCNIKTKDGIYRRMKNLQAAGVIDFHPDNQKQNKTFFAWGAAYDILISDSSTSIEADNLRIKNRRGTDQKPEGYGSKTGGGTDQKPDNHYTNNPYTNPYTKEGGKNAQNALTPPFTKTGEIEIPENVFPLEAKNQNELAGGVGPTPLLVTTFTPQEPYTRVVEMVALGPQTPGEKIRAMIADGNYKIKEVFSMNRKIPADRFDEYLTAFDREKTALPVPPTYKDANDLVSNFWNWSGIRWGVEQRAKQGGQQVNTGRGATIVRSGGDPAKYEEKQVF